jgi:hypothetical protein
VAQIVKQKGMGIVFVTAHAGLPELLRDWANCEILAKPAAPQDVIRAATKACKKKEHR